MLSIKLFYILDADDWNHLIVVGSRLRRFPLPDYLTYSPSLVTRKSSKTRKVLLGVGIQYVREDKNDYRVNTSIADRSMMGVEGVRIGDIRDRILGGARSAKDRGDRPLHVKVVKSVKCCVTIM